MATIITLGIDIGGTAIKAIGVGQDLKLHNKFDTPSNAKEGGPKAVLQAITTTLRYYQEKGFTLKNIGIGCAGSIDSQNGVVRNSPNFSGWKNEPLAQWVQEETKIKVNLENDANCAVLAEWKIGAAEPYQNVVLLTFGTGIGGGLVLNDKLYSGSTGTAGELGHFSIRANGLECPCGNTGCFERYCSGRAVENKAPGFTAKDIFENQDRPKFKKIVDEFISDLCIGLTGLSNVFDPDCFVFGGALNRGLTPFYKTLQNHLKQHAFPSVGEHVKILPTQYENWSGAIGAALLADHK